MEEKQAKFYIGPAGWSYPDWDGVVYPSRGGMDKLKFIASRFNCIEINNSFYRIPPGRIVRSWAERTCESGDFLFTVKAWRKFSHERELDDKGVADFIDSIAPLKERNLLGAILVQFPWSFKFNRENSEYISRIGNAFDGLPLAVEVRHVSWNTNEALNVIRGSKLAFCNIDQPVIGESIPPTAHITRDDFAYIRLHGRNAREWFKEGVGRDQRYNYLYSTDELDSWSKRAMDIAKRVEKVFIITNNHFRGQAIVNAYQMRFLLEGKKQPVPRSLLEHYPLLSDMAFQDEPQGGLDL